MRNIRPGNTNELQQKAKATPNSVEAPKFAAKAFLASAGTGSGLPRRKWSKSRVRIGSLLKGEFHAASEI